MKYIPLDTPYIILIEPRVFMDPLIILIEPRVFMDPLFFFAAGSTLANAEVFK